MSQAQQPPSGPPYAPRVAGIGGVPSILPDVPVSAVFLAIFVGFAATNMTIFQINRRRHHKFIPTVLLFGFCMARVATLVMRIAWATRPNNVQLSIAANIFSAAGVLILYIINVLFAQRILRAENPKLGWNRVLRIFFKIFYAGIGGALIMVITATVISVYTLNMSTISAARDVQRAAGIYLFVFTWLPMFLLAAAQFSPRSDEDSFGQGSLWTKKIVIFTTTCLAIVNTGFKVGTGWMPPRPINDPAWYQSKAAFYVFNFVIEIIILTILTVSRPDRMFHVPNGSKGPGDYTNLSAQTPRESQEVEKEEELEKV